MYTTILCMEFLPPQVHVLVSFGEQYALLAKKVNGLNLAMSAAASVENDCR